jgi:hypothetical protein
MPPSRNAARGRRTSLKKSEGVEHRKAPPLSLRLSAGAPVCFGRVAFRRSTCGFSVLGAPLPGEDGELFTSLIRALSQPFVRAHVQPLRQPVVVPADGYPRPPGAAVTSRSSGRRPSPAPGSVLQNAPRVEERMGLYD